MVQNFYSDTSLKYITTLMVLCIICCFESLNNLNNKIEYYSNAQKKINISLNYPSEIKNILDT